MDFVDLAGIITGVKRPIIHKDIVNYHCVVTYIAHNHKRHPVPVHISLYNPTVFTLHKMKQHLQIGKYLTVNGTFMHKYINSDGHKAFFNNYVFANEIMFTRTNFNINEVVLNGFIGSKVYTNIHKYHHLVIEFYLITNNNFAPYLKVPVEIFIQNPQRISYWQKHIQTGNEICVTNGKFRSKMFQSRLGLWYNMNSVFVKDDGVQVGKNHFTSSQQAQKIISNKNQENKKKLQKNNLNKKKQKATN